MLSRNGLCLDRDRVKINKDKVKVRQQYRYIQEIEMEGLWSTVRKKT
jgi:hypothetical protein